MWNFYFVTVSPVMRHKYAIIVNKHLQTYITDLESVFDCLFFY